MSREIFGIIGSLEDTSAEKRFWNSLFEEEGIDAFMDYYPTKEDQLPERLSEMFHHDRRGYIVGEALQEAIIPLLDRVELGQGLGLGQGRVDTVVNRGGVLFGFNCGSSREKRRELWLQ